MKRLAMFPMLFLTALFLTLTASAAESAIHSVAIDGDAVKVSVTAQADCHLFVALYGESGQLLDAQSADLFASAKQRTVTLVFPDSIPEKAYAKALLMDRNTRKPLTKSVSTRADDTPTPTPALDSDVYAILYADGELVFQHGGTPESGREVRETYSVDMAKEYDITEIPWRNTRSYISQMNFADEIQPTSTAFWFSNCPILREVKNIKNLDTTNITDMSYMFSYCRALTTLDLSALNSSNVTNMSHMFLECNALTTLNFGAFDTANVTDMEGMFRKCSAIAALDLSRFNTANVTKMGDMFWYCRALTTLDLSGFDTVKVTDMHAMFAGCENLKTLDLSAFNTINLIDMCVMFSSCGSLTTIYASEQFVTTQVEAYGYQYDDRSNGKDVFLDCSSIIGGNGTTYDRGKTGSGYARIDGGASNPGYFTAKT